MNPHVDLGAAADFIWRNARVLERHVFAALFLGGDMMRALEALRPYQNKDGGFGNGLEPDIRGPVSQPVPTEFAFRTLDQVGAIEETMIGRACDYLQTITTDEGGVPWGSTVRSRLPEGALVGDQRQPACLAQSDRRGSGTSPKVEDRAPMARSGNRLLLAKNR